MARCRTSKWCVKTSHAQAIPLLRSLAPIDNYFPVVTCEHLKRRQTQLEFIKHRFDSASVQRPQAHLITFCFSFLSAVSEFCLIKAKSWDHCTRGINRICFHSHISLLFLFKMQKAGLLPKNHWQWFIPVESFLFSYSPHFSSRYIHVTSSRDTNVRTPLRVEHCGLPFL